MADFNGNFQYLAADGRATQEGDCRVQLDAETLTVVPVAAPPIAVELGDLTGVVAANFQVRLPIYSGQTLVLRQFGQAYERLGYELLEAYRNRTVQCMLLADMPEMARFPGAFELYRAVNCPQCGARTRGTKFCPECGAAVSSPPSALSSQSERQSGMPAADSRQPAADSPQQASGEAEIRLYESNLAVLPTASAAFQWRLADVTAVHAGEREVVLENGELCLRFSQLARRTAEFAAKVKDAISAVGARGAQALHLALPFLSPDQFQAVAALLREGRPARLSALAAIHPRIPAALAANAVDTDLKPYYDDLVRRSLPGMIYAGFKLVRPEDQQSSDEEGDEDGPGAPDADQSDAKTLYWFFFPLARKPGTTDPANVVAWEACSRSGRATYFFRISTTDDAKGAEKDEGKNCASSAPSASSVVGDKRVDAAIDRISSVLGTLNFRRRPIYLSDDQLEMNPIFRRYAVACQRMPEVREVRASFLGRAIHCTLEEWQAQVEAVAGGQ
jgi:hypothetical protein